MTIKIYLYYTKKKKNCLDINENKFFDNNYKF